MFLKNVLRMIYILLIVGNVYRIYYNNSDYEHIIFMISYINLISY